MIDHLDKQTQPLPLEQKRGRGRPATGQALSNAERQRLYRERQKAQRNEKPKGAVAWEDARALMAKIDELTAGLAKALERAEMAEAQLAQRNDNELMQRVELAEAERDAMGNELAKVKAKLSKVGPTKRRYILQWQDPEKGTWHDDRTGDYGSKAKADAACKAMNTKGFSQALWRVRERQWV